MTHILFISHTARSTAGSSQSLLLLVKYLRAKYEITVVVPEIGDLVEILKNEGVNCYVYPLRRKTIPGFIYFLFKKRPDIVYANNFSIQAYFALFAARLIFIPFIWHIREIDVFSPNPGEAAVYKRLRYSLRFAQAIIANSKATAESIIPHVPVKKISIVYNGVDLDKYDLDVGQARQFICERLNVPTDHLVVITVGRLTEDKNQLHVIEVVARLVQEHFKIVFCFLGEFRQPDYVDRLRHRATDLNILESIRLAGSQNEIEKYILGADILLHTSRSESQGRVLIEAMAARIPVVAYNVGGVSESVMDGQTGFLVPFGDMDGLASALKKLVKNPELRTQMGEKGYRRVETMFTAEKTARQVSQIIAKVLNLDK